MQVDGGHQGPSQAACGPRSRHRHCDNAESGKPGSVPAPSSTTTVLPPPVRRLMAAGVTATLRSPGPFSAGTPSSIALHGATPEWVWRRSLRCRAFLGICATLPNDDRPMTNWLSDPRVLYTRSGMRRTGRPSLLFRHACAVTLAEACLDPEPTCWSPRKPPVGSPGQRGPFRSTSSRPKSKPWWRL